MKRGTVLPEINLDRSPRAPTLRRQIERQLASAIRIGSLPHGSRLPSSRLMARLLHVSRGTVVDAYEALLATGMVAAIAGSGVSVSHSSAPTANRSNLKRTIAASHYPVRICRVEDHDGTALYLNVIR